MSSDLRQVSPNEFVHDLFRGRPNYKYCLGGAGVLGIFILNEEHLRIHVSKVMRTLSYAHPHARWGIQTCGFHNLFGMHSL